MSAAVSSAGSGDGGGGGLPTKRRLYGESASRAASIFVPRAVWERLPSGRTAQWQRSVAAMGGTLIFDADPELARLTHVLCAEAPGPWLPSRLQPRGPGTPPPGPAYVAWQWLRDSIRRGSWLEEEDYEDVERVAAAEAAAAEAAAAPVQLEGHAGRCVGCLLAVMAGDCLGRPFERRTRNEWAYIREHHPEGLRDLPAELRYTDDTQMTLALAKSLVAEGRCEAEACSAEYWLEQERCQVGGYSRKTARTLEALALNKADYRSSGAMFWREGSYSNGAVMRIAPLGLAYRNAEQDVLRRAVADAARCTHIHPEAIDAATVQAAAVGMLAKSGVSEPALQSPQQLLQRLLPYAHTPAMHSRLEAIAKALDTLPQGSDSNAVRGSVWEGRPGDEQWRADRALLDQVVSDHTASYYWQIRAVDAAASALWALCRHWGHPEQAIEGAVHYGGDADTVGAITGALAGAQAGCSWVPWHWWQPLVQKVRHPESGTLALVKLAEQLAALDVRASE